MQLTAGDETRKYIHHSHQYALETPNSLVIPNKMENVKCFTMIHRPQLIRINTKKTKVLLEYTRKMHNRFKFKKIINSLLLLCFALLLSACSTLSASNGVFKQYTVGVGTHSGNKIWGRVIRFDSGWGMPSGAVACCWEETTKTTTAYNQPMPKEVYVEWIEMKTQLLYKARIKIDPKITKLANNLPGYIWGGETKKETDMTLIIGMGKDGEAVIWLSNARAAGNKTGRVLYVVGKTKAYSEPWVVPSDY